MSVLRPGYILTVSIACLAACTGPNHPDQPGRPIIDVSIDTTSAFPGENLTVGINITPNEGAVAEFQSLAQLDFHIEYDEARLSFLGVESKDAASNWEYFTWRLSHARYEADPSVVTVTAIRDLATANNEIAPPPYVPSGCFCEIKFLLSSNRDYIGDTAHFGFRTGACDENTMTLSGDPDEILISTDMEMTGQPSPSVDTLDCPRRLSLHPAIRFWAGSVAILEPPDDRCLTFDATGYPDGFTELATFILYLDIGLAILSQDPLCRKLQFESADLDGDGVPFTRLDYDILLQNVCGYNQECREKARQHLQVLGISSMRKPIATIRSLYNYGRRGDVIDVPLRLEYSTFGRFTSQPLGSMFIRLHTEPQTLTIESVLPGESLSGWEYFTYRYEPPQSCNTCVRESYVIVAGIRDMNNGIDPVGALGYPEGLLAHLMVRIPQDFPDTLRSGYLHFTRRDCQDNTLGSIYGDTVYAPMFPESQMINEPGFDGSECDCPECDCPVCRYDTAPAVVFQGTPIGVRR